MSLPSRRTAAGRKRWADAERSLRALGWVKISGHGWFVTTEDAMAMVEVLRELTDDTEEGA
jgi:hypothetical protein